MLSPSRNRKAFNVKEKLDAFARVKSGVSQTQVAREKTLFTLLVRMPQTVLFRVISTRLHVKGQPLYGCLTLRVKDCVGHTL